MTLVVSIKSSSRRTIDPPDRQVPPQQMTAKQKTIRNYSPWWRIPAPSTLMTKVTGTFTATHPATPLCPDFVLSSDGWLFRTLIQHYRGLGLSRCFLNPPQDLLDRLLLMSACLPRLTCRPKRSPESCAEARWTMLFPLCDSFINPAFFGDLTEFLQRIQTSSPPQIYDFCPSYIL